MPITASQQIAINRIECGFASVWEGIHKIQRQLDEIKISNEKCEAMYRRACTQGDTCPITGDTFRGMREFCATDCGHLFDHGALESWQNSGRSASNRCPVCRSPYKIVYISAGE